MRRSVLHVFAIFVFAVYPAVQVLAQPPQVVLDSQRLLSKSHAFLNHSSDLLDLAKGQEGTLEFEIAMDLNGEATLNSERLFSAGNLVLVYEQMTCSSDKAFIRLYVQRVLNAYIKNLEQSISGVNLGLANTHRPGVATTAAGLRDELRESKALIESMVLR